MANTSASAGNTSCEPRWHSPKRDSAADHSASPRTPSTTGEAAPAPHDKTIPTTATRARHMVSAVVRLRLVFVFIFSFKFFDMMDDMDGEPSRVYVKKIK